MGVRIITQPTVEPITLEDVRRHLGIEPYVVDSNGDGTHPHDDMIMAMLASAREWAENFTGRSIALKTYELALDTFPPGNESPRPNPEEDVLLPHPPVVSITSVKYVDGELVEQTIDAANYSLDRYQETSGWLSPAYGATWPVPAAVVNAVKIRYRAGYQVPEPDSNAEDADDLPHPIRASLLLMVGHLYENREAVSITNMPFEVPLAVEHMLRPYRIRTGMA